MFLDKLKNGRQSPFHFLKKVNNYRVLDLKSKCFFFIHDKPTLYPFHTVTLPVEYSPGGTLGAFYPKVTPAYFHTVSAHGPIS